MDKVSASLANIICGNEEGEAVIEMTLHGVEMMFNEDAYCSFTGGGCKVFVDDVELPFNRLIHVPAYSVIKTVHDVQGCRSYLSIAGGLEIKKELGSASTYSPSVIGGIHGRNLVTGDIIHFKKNQTTLNKSSLKPLSNNISVSPWEVQQIIPLHIPPSTLYLIKGPEFELFTKSSQEKLFSDSFTISSKSNRMGYRLEGEQFALNEKIEMASTPVATGIMQVTHEGDPIILMADAQTTGGYPRIARVCAADIPLLAQMRPGEKISFTEIDEEESEIRYNKLQEVLRRVRMGVKG